MNPFQANTPPETEVQYFKEKVQRWLNVDKQIAELEKKQADLVLYGYSCVCIKILVSLNSSKSI